MVESLLKWNALVNPKHPPPCPPPRAGEVADRPEGALLLSKKMQQVILSQTNLSRNLLYYFLVKEIIHLLFRRRCYAFQGMECITR